LKIARAEVPGLPRGGIVGKVEVVGCEWDRRKDSFAWQLERPSRYATVFHPIGQPLPAFWLPRWA
jgi:hypothetical protein